MKASTYILLCGTFLFGCKTSQDASQGLYRPSVYARQPRVDVVEKADNIAKEFLANKADQAKNIVVDNRDVAHLTTTWHEQPMGNHKFTSTLVYCQKDSAFLLYTHEDAFDARASCYNSVTNLVGYADDPQITPALYKLVPILKDAIAKSGSQDNMPPAPPIHTLPTPGMVVKPQRYTKNVYIARYIDFNKKEIGTGCCGIVETRNSERWSDTSQLVQQARNVLSKHNRKKYAPQ